MFALHLKKPETKIFIVSLYEIDYAIKERKKEASGFVLQQDDETKD